VEIGDVMDVGEHAGKVLNDALHVRWVVEAEAIDRVAIGVDVEQAQFVVGRHTEVAGRWHGA
jgi:hypothetical protein